MKQRTVARLAWTVWGLTVASLAGFVVFGALAHILDPNEYALIPVIVMGFATVGALIVSRRGGNRIGWVFSWFALAGSFGWFAGNYASYGIVSAPGSVPAATLAAWIGRSAFAATLLPLPLMFLLFPDGRVPTRRWRPVLWIILAAAAVAWVGFSFGPGPVSAGFTELHRPLENPFGFPVGWKPAVEAVATAAGFVVFGGGLASVLALVLRFRRSRGEERQQIRWLVYVGATAVLVLILNVSIEFARPLLGIEVSEDDLVTNLAFIVFVVTLLLGIPAAAAIAILRYRLYELDVVIKKTVVFAILVVLIMAVSFVVVLAVGGLAAGPLSDWRLYDSPSGLIAYGAAIGLLVWPLRRVARRVADRVVYGGRATPYEVLTDFSERMAGAYSTDDVLPRMAQILGAGTGAERAQVWLRVGGELRPAASWPAEDGAAPIGLRGDELPSFPDQHAVEVRHQGELLGALSVRAPANDPMNPAKAKLVQGLAAQAGLVLRNVRLIEELPASRQRLVAAQDEERRKIQRNLHDGAQQQLIALSVKLRLARNLSTTDPEKSDALFAQIEMETTDALEILRDLARGIYPPLLADKGLAEALASQARKAPVPVEMDTHGVGRYPQEIESAVYFCCLEALTNVAKYASASHAELRLSAGDGDLRFEVEDDGAGFDPGAVAHGTGLQGMADRLDAIGGALEIRSAPGSGTTVTGTVPVRERTR